MTTPPHLFGPASTGGMTGPGAEFFDGTVLPNLRAGVGHLLSRRPRRTGIDEIEDDPVYENLYDRFYAVMSDGAGLEHLAVAELAEDDPAVEMAGSRELAALVAAWEPETRREVGYGNAYALTRLLKSLAIGFDVFGHALPEADHPAAADFLERLATVLWTQWFSKADVRGPIGVQPGRHSPHHASVEWSGFGVAALALLGRCDAASTWVDATAEHFERELLPRALAVDGAPPEGRDFWVSTMFSRAQFVDALQHVTGRDLFGTGAWARTDLPEALFRATPPLDPAEQGECRLAPEEWQLLPRGGGAVLLWLAARTGDPRLQALGMLDRRAGALESSSFSLPRSRTRLRLATSSYAAMWMSTAVAPAPSLDPFVAAFPSVSLCATSRGWRTGGFSAAIDEGRILLWAGDELVLRDLVPRSCVDLEQSRDSGAGINRYKPQELFAPHVTAARLPGGADLLEARNQDGEVVARVRIDPGGQSVKVERRLGRDHRWRTGMRLRATELGSFLDGHSCSASLDLAGCVIAAGAPADVTTVVGYGLLRCSDDPGGLVHHDHLVEATTETRWAAVDLRLEPVK